MQSKKKANLRVNPPHLKERISIDVSNGLESRTYTTNSNSMQMQNKRYHKMLGNGMEVKEFPMDKSMMKSPM